MYMMTHVVPPLASSIANGGLLDLSKDTECLLLLDSMLNGSSYQTRSFYFWVVSKTLQWSDGYYSEGVGNIATSYLFKQPSEFLHSWFYLTTPMERDHWAYFLAGEQAIVTEGYPCDTVMGVFRSKLSAAIPSAEKDIVPTSDLLVYKVDSVLRQLKTNE